jgi:hypothetical protein
MREKNHKSTKRSEPVKHKPSLDVLEQNFEHWSSARSSTLRTIPSNPLHHKHTERKRRERLPTCPTKTRNNPTRRGGDGMKPAAAQ